MTAISSDRRTTAPSSPVSRPTRIFGSAMRGSTRMICPRSSGPSLHPQPPPWLNCVKRTSILVLLHPKVGTIVEYPKHTSSGTNSHGKAHLLEGANVLELPNNLHSAHLGLRKKLEDREWFGEFLYRHHCRHCVPRGLVPSTAAHNLGLHQPLSQWVVCAVSAFLWMSSPLSPADASPSPWSAWSACASLACAASL